MTSGAVASAVTTINQDLSNRLYWYGEEETRYSKSDSDRLSAVSALIPKSSGLKMINYSGGYHYLYLFGLINEQTIIEFNCYNGNICIYKRDNAGGYARIRTI